MRAHILESLIAVSVMLSSSAAQTTSNPGFIPAGTQIVLSLKQAISSRTARDGDPVYAETVFPVIGGGRVEVPARTPMQGVVFKVKHAGKLKGHPQIGIRFTSMIREDGTVIALDGPLSNTPGGERLSVDQAQSAIVGDRRSSAQVDEGIHQVTRGAFHGAFLGLLFGGTVTALRVGAGLGMAGGLTFAILSRPTDMRLRPGTQIQITLQSPIQLTQSSTPNQKAPATRPATTPSDISTALILSDEARRRP